MFKGLNGNKNHFIVRKNIKIIWLFYTDEQPACCISPISKRALSQKSLYPASDIPCILYV